MGRVTYEEMAAHWPTSSDDYAAPMNEIPKVVFSKTLDEATWAESSIARGDLADEIDTLRRRPGGEIIAWGGAGFAQSLSRAALVDEYVRRPNRRCHASVELRHGCDWEAAQMRDVPTFVTVSAPLRRDGEQRRWYADGAGSCVVLTRRGRLLEPHPIFGPTCYRLLALRVSTGEASVYAQAHGLPHERVLPTSHDAPPPR